MFVTCLACGCKCAHGAAAHAVQAALAEDDLDRALALGLLNVGACSDCDPACMIALLTAREMRIRALAARERFRAREARLARRRNQRSERRIDAAAAGTAAPTTAPLPAAAAAALARAKAKAASHR